jgi:prefoldin alpha subunit
MEMNEAMETIQVQKSYIASLAKQLEMMDQTIHQNTLARETLEGLKDRSDGTEVLVPIGASTKAFVSMSDISRVIVDIGSGVEIEMNVEEAITHHNSLLTKLNEERMRLQGKLKELEQSTATLSMAVERAYQEQMQQRMGPQGGAEQNLFS